MAKNDLKKHWNFYGNLNSFIRFDSGEYQSDLLKAFLENRPQDIKNTITRVCPRSLTDTMKIDSWGWVDKLVGPHGALRIAEEKIRSEYTALQKLMEEKTKEFPQAKNQQQRNRINNKINWAERRMKTLKQMGLIDFLSSHVVLPKYGFPVDVVDLTLLSNEQAGRNVRLERDLKIAISEFAPSSKIVANGYVWESTGLRVVPNRAWEENQYEVCENCGRFHISPAMGEFPEACEGCGSVLPKSKRHRFVIPIFGFISGTFSQTQKAGLYRPHTAFGSRPYFYDYERPEEETVDIWGIPVTRRYSHRGSLAVISRGQSGAGYRRG